MSRPSSKIFRRVATDDPAAEYFREMNFLLAIPQFDDGNGLNTSVIMTRDARIPRDGFR